jgi:hypothetical protein
MRKKIEIIQSIKFDFVAIDLRDMIMERNRSITPLPASGRIFDIVLAAALRCGNGDVQAQRLSGEKFSSGL